MGKLFQPLAAARLQKKKSTGMEERGNRSYVIAKKAHLLRQPLPEE